MNSHARTALWAVLVSLFVFAADWGQVPRALAQEEAAPAEPAAEGTDAGAAPSGDAATPEGGEAKAEGAESQNYLSWIIEVSGWIGAIILLLSIYMVATVVRMFMELRPEVFTPVALLEEAEKLLQAQDFMGLYKRVKADNSYFATTLTAGISELQVGLPEAREAVERVGEVNTIALERKISMLAVCGTLGPMIGLLGTLKGMIASFSVIAMSDTQLKASQVAGGISEALVLTFEGVALSVPAIYFYALFKNRINSYSASTMLEADAFLRRLYAAMKSKASSSTSAPSAPKA